MAKGPSIQKMPINAPPYNDISDVALSTSGSQLINGVIYPLEEEKRYLTLNRPGLLLPAFCDLNIPYAINGLFWWSAKQYVLTVCNGLVFKIDKNGIKTQIPGVTVSTGRVVFSQVGLVGAYTFMASGSALVYTDGVTLKNPLGLGVPTASTHVTFMDTRIIANEVGTNQFKWSDPDQVTASSVVGTDGNYYICKLSHISTEGKDGCSTASALAMGTTKTAIGWSEFTYYIAGIEYTKGANLAGLALSAGTILSGTYGIFLFSINVSGTVTITAGANNFDGTYTTVTDARDALPAIPANSVAMGNIIIIKTDGDFIDGTTNLDATNVEVYSTSTLDFEAGNQPVTGSVWSTYWEQTSIVAESAWELDKNYGTGWQGLNVASLEGKGDTLMALDSRFDEIVLVGKDHTEYYYNDGTSPFAKYEGTTSEVGTVAKYSVVFDGNKHWMLDNDLNLITLINRAPQVVSNPFASLLQGMGTVDDCFITPIKCDGQNFIVLNFPTANISLAYDVKNNIWQGQWGTWNLDRAVFDQWIPNCYCKCPEWGFDLVGDRRTGKIYKISRNYATDAEKILRIVKRTGHNDYGIRFKKRSKRIRIVLKRGQGLSDPDQEPIFTMKSRKNGAQEWEDEREGSMGLVGDTNAIVEFRQNGIFRERQDEYVFSDSVPLTIVEGEEEIEVMGN